MLVTIWNMFVPLSKLVIMSSELRLFTQTNGFSIQYLFNNEMQRKWISRGGTFEQTNLWCAAANLRTNIAVFGGSYSSRILVSRGGIPRPMGDFPESLSQRILVLSVLVWRLAVRELIPRGWIVRSEGTTWRISPWKISAEKSAEAVFDDAESTTSASLTREEMIT